MKALKAILYGIFCIIMAILFIAVWVFAILLLEKIKEGLSLAVIFLGFWGLFIFGNDK